jgi:putative oxidoreductase
MKRIVTTELISSLLIFLFGYTAISKLLSIHRFEAVLEQSPLISSGAALLAWQIPLAELGIVLLLIFSSTRKWGLWASLLMFSFFTVYLGYMILFTPQLPCSCGGIISSMSWKGHVLFNLFFIGLTVVGIRGLRFERIKLLKMVDHGLEV